MEIINKSTPDEEYRKMFQEFVKKISDMRYYIDRGDFSWLYAYQLTLRSGYRNIEGYMNEKESKECDSILNEIKNLTPVNQSINIFGDQKFMPTPQFSIFMENIDKLDRLLRRVLIRQSFLTQTVQKSMRLT